MNFLSRRRRTSLLGQRRNQSPIRSAFTPTMAPPQMETAGQGMQEMSPVVPQMETTGHRMANPLFGPQFETSGQGMTYGVPQVNPALQPKKKQDLAFDTIGLEQ